jgi:hypothetical protein
LLVCQEEEDFGKRGLFVVRKRKIARDEDIRKCVW